MKIIPFLLILLSIIPGNKDHWRLQLCLGMICIFILFGQYLWRKIHWSASLPFMVCGINAAFMTFAPISPWVDYGVFGETAFDSVSAQSGFLLLGITVPFMLADEDDLDLWAIGFGYLGLINSILMITAWMKNITPDGILSNPAIDASLVACLYPLMVLRRTRVPWANSANATKYPVQLIISIAFIILPVFAVFIARSNTGLAIMAGEMLLYYILTHDITNTKLAIITLTVGGFVILSRFLLKEKFLHSDGRMYVWRLLLAHYDQLRHYWVGNGAGSYRLFGPMVQKQNGMNIGFIWAHNEPLQILFEQGILGLLSCLTLFYQMLKRSFKEPWIFSTIAGLGVCMITQFPLRVFPFALFCAFMVRTVFQKR